MAITSISSQPEALQIVAAYRPILFTVEDSATPPVMYCDVYLNGVFYRTISKTQYLSKVGDATTWRFDVQDVAQEVLGVAIPDINRPFRYTATKAFATCFCRFRSSSYDADGFVEPQATAPVQGTGGSAPVAGTGTESNQFIIVNATIQHEQNQNFEQMLEAIYPTRYEGYNVLPLTRRPEGLRIGVYQSDYFPIATKNDPAIFSRVKIRYRFHGQSTFQEAITDLNNTP